MSRRRSNKRGRFRPSHAADSGQKGKSSDESKSSASKSDSQSGSSH